MSNELIKCRDVHFQTEAVCSNQYTPHLPEHSKIILPQPKEIRDSLLKNVIFKSRATYLWSAD